MANQYTLILSRLLLAGWFIRTLKSALEQIYIWQLKEYRRDRLRAHLATRRGRALILNAMTLWKWGLLLALLVTPARLLAYAVLLTYIGETAHAFWLLRQHRLRRPQLTAKALLIFAIAISAEIGGMFVALYVLLKYALLNFYYIAVIAILLDRALPLLIAGVIGVLTPLTNIIKRRKIRAARAKMSRFPDLKVVGITGSYGKSSTKEFVYTILSTRFNVLKTPANTNTDVGVAQVVLRDLSAEHEVFVVEMGAYKPREIADICAIVAPRIGVVTAINEQHLALFGKIETTIATKFELVDALPSDGLAVLNGDNTHVAERARQTKTRQVVYSMENRNRVSPEKPDFLRAENVIVSADEVEFDVVRGAERQRFVVNLLGRHNVGNILAAVAVALELGMTLPEIAAAAQQITPSPGAMRAYSGVAGTTLIDDAYNANPAGVLAALEYLRARPASRRVIVATGMLELGAATVEAHRTIGRAMAQVCDLVVIMGPDFVEHYLVGIEERKKVIMGKDWRVVVGKLRAYLSAGDVVLFEGRGTGRVLQQLLNL